MLTGKNLLNELVDQLNELKLSHMAAKLDSLYHAPGLRFLHFLYARPLSLSSLFLPHSQLIIASRTISHTVGCGNMVR